MAIFDCIIQLYTLYNCVIGCTNNILQIARTHCCLNVGPLSSTLSQRWNSVGQVLASLRVYCHLAWCSQARRCRLIAGALRLALMFKLGGVAREARVSSWSGVPNRSTQAHIWQGVVGSTPCTQVEVDWPNATREWLQYIIVRTVTELHLFLNPQKFPAHAWEARVYRFLYKYSDIISIKVEKQKQRRN